MLKLVDFDEVKIDNLITYYCKVENDNDSALETLENRLDICDIHYDNLSNEDLEHFKVVLSNDGEKWFIMLICGEQGFIVISNNYKFRKKTYEIDMQKAFDDWLEFPKKVYSELGDSIIIKEYDDDITIQIKK